jgi:hypothetical protein
MGDFDDDMPQIEAKNKEVEAPSGALLPSPPSEMSETFDRMGPDAGALATITGTHGIGPDDPLWSAIQVLLDVRAERAGTVAAAGQATAAAARIEAAAHGVGQTIFNQTVRAGDDLKTLLAASIEEKTVEVGKAVVAVIQHTVGEGAAAIKKAAASLPSAANAQRDDILKEWRAALTTTAAQEVAHRARRGEWWIMGGILLGMILMAAIGGWVGRATAPQAWPAGAPPAAMWKYPQQNMDEFAWHVADARLTRSCPPGDLCLLLRRR